MRAASGGWLAALWLAAAPFARAWGPCPEGSEETNPLCVEGAQVSVSSTTSGVTIVVTAQEPAAVAAIQQAVARGSAAPRMKHGSKKKAHFLCPLGDYSGEATPNGNCPNCGKHLHQVHDGPAPDVQGRAAATSAPPPLRCPKGHYTGAKTPDGRCPVCQGWLKEGKD